MTVRSEQQIIGRTALGRLVILSTMKLATFHFPPIVALYLFPARAAVTRETVCRSATPISSKAAAPQRFRELICHPFCGRMRCDAKPKNLPPAMPHDQQAGEQTKRDCRDDEQIHRLDAVGMIIEKCFPTLGRRATTPGHILGHARLPDIDAELEKLPVDPRRSPQRIGNAHLED